MLRHWPLANDFTGGDKGGVFLFHDAGGLFEPVNSAIDAGIYIFSKPEMRVFKHCQVFFTFFNYSNGHAKFFGFLFYRVMAIAHMGIERKNKMKRQHVEPLAFKYVHGDSAVEPPGKHDDAFYHIP